MNFKEVKLRVEGYISYCNLMLGTKLLFRRNKKYNQFEIIKKDNKKDIGRMIISIETGYAKEKLTIRCYNASQHYEELICIYPDLFIKFNEVVFVIYNEDDLFTLFQNLEHIGFFGNEKSY